MRPRETPPESEGNEWKTRCSWERSAGRKKKQYFWQFWVNYSAHTLSIQYEVKPVVRIWTETYIQQKNVFQFMFGNKNESWKKNSTLVIHPLYLFVPYACSSILVCISSQSNALQIYETTWFNCRIVMGIGLIWRDVSVDVIRLGTKLVNIFEYFKR